MTQPDPLARPPRRPASNRGAWTVVAIFALGLTVLGGLFLAPRGHAPPLPAGTPRGRPDQPVVGVLLDCKPIGASPDAIVAAVRRLADSARSAGDPPSAGDPLRPGATPDLVVLVDVEGTFVPPVIAALGLQGSYHPQLYQRVRPTAGEKVKVGVCVLSKHPLYAGRPIRTADRSIGVAADVVIAGRAFTVACVDVKDQSAAAGGLAAVDAKAEETAGTQTSADARASVGVLVGRAAGRVFAGTRDATFVAVAGDNPVGPTIDRVEVVRRQDAPPGLVLRVVPLASPAPRPG